ncbi:hypothetical protein AB0H76_06055 [Nocardia sp. NPDC050712]|uniref:hypothetical protein n=1 Tax=Nocardia sp. NPDC050712 TaxID=3155518 RepID=UPI0033F5AB77
MAPDSRRSHRPWYEPTEVIEPVRVAPPLPRRSRVQPILIGLTAVTVAAGVTAISLWASGFFEGSRGGPSPSATAAPTTAAGTSSPRTAQVPVPGAVLAAVTSWIQAGTPVDPAPFHTATAEDGKPTDLGAAVAFVSPTKKIRCMSPRDADNPRPGMTCLVQFDNEPARPPSLPPEGNWVGGWTVFGAGAVGIGALRGDPGDFTLGDGPVLNYGSRLSFNEFDCRMDQAGLFCVDQKAVAGIRLSSSGAEPYGCLSDRPSNEHAIAFACAAATAAPPR